MGFWIKEKYKATVEKYFDILNEERKHTRKIETQKKNVIHY